MNRGDKMGQMGDLLPILDFGTSKIATSIASAGKTTCALLNDGTVKCWGLNDNGQLGQGDKMNRADNAGEMGENLPPINLGTGKTAKGISVGAFHVCALLNDNTVKCWGDGGALGRGDTVDRGDDLGEMGDALPTVDLGTGKSAKAIAVAGVYSCAILSDDTVKCWGYNGTGALGLGDANSRGDEPNEMGDNLPVVNLGTGKKAMALAAHGTRVCVILSDNTIKCWGLNGSGQLGLGDIDTRGDQALEMGDNLPVVDIGANNIPAAISIGQDHACVLLADHSVKCWGGNAEGQLGLGDMNNRGDQPLEMGDKLPTVKLFSDVW